MEKNKNFYLVYGELICQLVLQLYYNNSIFEFTFWLARALGSGFDLGDSTHFYFIDVGSVRTN